MTRSRSSSIRIHAPAKINLSLRVLGTRRDGFHDVRTVLQSLALHDTLIVNAAPGPFTITCEDPRCPTDSSNLVWRAADLVWRAAKRRGAPKDVRVTLHKRIPMQAGLGGGSSDAAAALRALAAFWRVEIGHDGLVTLAQSLGSDVSFFLHGGTALGLDRGDELFQLVDAPPAWVVLIVPDFGVSTPDAYRWWDRDRRQDSDRSVNDLQTPVARRHPEIARIVTRLDRLGARSAAMSGSGSAVFGLFDGERPARAAARALERGLGTVHVTRTLGHRVYSRLARPGISRR